MANSYVQLPADGPGKKLDTEQITVGANTVERERNQLAGVAAGAIAAVLDSDPADSDFALAVRSVDVVNPIGDAITATLAAGASVNLDGTTIASGKTGKLQSVIVSSTAALCKFTIIARDGGVELTLGVCFTSQERPTFTWTPPDKRYDTQVYVGGDENFRVKAKNLDPLNAADVYATIYWDEV